MFRKPVSSVMISLLVLGTLAFVFNVQQVKASGTIYIRPDGSIGPTTANITTFDNITYTFTGNISDSMAIERDSIVVDGVGYAVMGNGDWMNSTVLTGRSNVTTKNMSIRNFFYGIWLGSSSGNVLSGNNAGGTKEGRER